MIYDSHAHIVSGDLTSFPSANADDPRVRALLDNPFSAEKLTSQMAQNGVDKALLVQRGQVYGFDNHYVLAAAAASDGRLNAVCGVNIRDENVATQLGRLQAEGAAGFRLMAPIADKSLDWLEGPYAHAFWSRAADIGLPVCIHFFPWNREAGIERLLALLAQYPVCDVVIDHLSNAPITDETQAGIDDHVRALAERPEIHLKFTAIPLNELAAQNIDAGAVLKAQIALFGEDRLMWGSDVTQSAGSYEALVASARTAVAALPEAIQVKLLQANAARVYAL